MGIALDGSLALGSVGGRVALRVEVLSSRGTVGRGLRRVHQTLVFLRALMCFRERHVDDASVEVARKRFCIATHWPGALYTHAAGSWSAARLHSAG